MIAVLAASFIATVVAISDGDTLTALDAAKAQHKIRLAQIDAPEKAQAFGQRSKESLSALAYRKECEIRVETKDRYRREVATVICDGVDVNRAQVRAGMAWAYRQYLTDKTLLDDEEAARKARLGLWRDPDQQPPWEFRKGKRDKNRP